MAGTECDEALLLLTRHGSTKDFVFRRWEPEPDVETLDPASPREEAGFDLDSGGEPEDD